MDLLLFLRRFVVLKDRGKIHMPKSGSKSKGMSVLSEAVGDGNASIRIIDIGPSDSNMIKTIMNSIKIEECRDLEIDPLKWKISAGE